MTLNRREAIAASTAAAVQAATPRPALDTKEQVFTEAVTEVADKLKAAGLISQWEVRDQRNNEKYPNFYLRMTWLIDGHNMVTTFSAHVDEIGTLTDADYRIRIYDAIDDLLFLYKENEIRKDGVDPEEGLKPESNPATSPLLSWLLRNDERFQKLRDKAKDVCNSEQESELIYASNPNYDVIQGS